MFGKVVDVLDKVFPPSVAFPVAIAFVTAHIARAKRRTS